MAQGWSRRANVRAIFEHDLLTSEQRIQAAINLQVADRVPSCPFIYHFAARYAGITAREMWSDSLKCRKALSLCFEELGPWDAYYPVNPRYPVVYSFAVPVAASWPGVELGDDSTLQAAEIELMKAEDYARVLASAGKHRLLARLVYSVEMAARACGLPGGWRAFARVLPRLAMHLAGRRGEFEAWKRMGVTTLYGFLLEAPFDSFSLSRSLRPFVRDCRERPGEVAAAASALTDGHCFVTRAATALLGVRRAGISLHRSSNDFISPRTFRELSLPSLKELVDRLVAAGVTPVLHLDGDWEGNLPALRSLPAGSCIVQFDGRTNIFLAKEVVGDRICIMGDVPAALLKLGSASQVDEYCHRLIEEVGAGGGFVMAAGCEVPPDARPENVRVMLDSVRRYGYYGAVPSRARRPVVRARVKAVASPGLP